jgi:outer membrane scaffolding protein for murein synthesis (MipA/OmpV family)
VGALLTCLLAASPALADSDGLPQSGPGWIVTVGGSLEAAPSYAGASQFSFRGMPSISWRRPDEPPEYSAPDDSFDLSLVKIGTFEAGPVANFQAARHDGSLPGIKNLPWTIEPGAFAQFWPIPDRLRLRAELLHPLENDAGWIADLSADWVEKLGRFTLSGGPRLTLIDGTEAAKLFGVSYQEASAGGVPAFDPDAGVAAFGGLFAVGYEWSDEWSTTLYTKYERLVGPAASSPITSEFGQPDQWSVGLEVDYSFLFNP